MKPRIGTDRSLLLQDKLFKAALRMECIRSRNVALMHFFNLPALLKFTNTTSFAAWFVVTGDATADEIRVERSVLGALARG